MKRSAPLAVLLLVFAAVPAACSKSTPPPTTPGSPMPDAGANGADGGAMIGAMGPASGAPSASSAPSSSASAPMASASASGPVGVDMGPALDAAIDVAIKAASVKSAPGMNAEGQPGRATLKEGERFNMVVTLQPNRCYTFVGFSPPGQVADLELHLMAPPFYTVEAGKSGASDKATPVLGKGKAGATCPILPVPVPYRLDVVAKKGGGRIGVQVFARDK